MYIFPSFQYKNIINFLIMILTLALLYQQIISKLKGSEFLQADFPVMGKIKKIVINSNLHFSILEMVSKRSKDFGKNQFFQLCLHLRWRTQMKRDLNQEAAKCFPNCLTRYRSQRPMVISTRSQKKRNDFSNLFHQHLVGNQLAPHQFSKIGILLNKKWSESKKNRICKQKRKKKPSPKSKSESF